MTDSIDPMPPPWIRDRLRAAGATRRTWREFCANLSSRIIANAIVAEFAIEDLGAVELHLADGSVATIVAMIDEAGRPGIPAVFMQPAPNEPSSVGVAALKHLGLTHPADLARLGVDGPTAHRVLFGSPDKEAPGSDNADMSSTLDRDQLLAIARIVAGEIDAHGSAQDDDLSVAEADRRWKAHAQIQWVRHLCGQALVGNDRDGLNRALARWATWSRDGAL